MAKNRDLKTELAGRVWPVDRKIPNGIFAIIQYLGSGIDFEGKDLDAVGAGVKKYPMVLVLPR